MDTLNNIQNELIVPKNQFNSFGKYKYRSCEDILEGLKIPLKKYNACVVLSDEMVMVGDRYYIKATAKLICKEGTIETTAYARESLDKKGMDDSQITGTASSYARKYALNGLFAIDDEKDADAREPEKPKTESKVEMITSEQVKALHTLITKTETNPEDIKKQYKVSSSKELTKKQASEVIDKLSKKTEAING